MKSPRNMPVQERTRGRNVAPTHSQPQR